MVDCTCGKELLAQIERDRVQTPFGTIQWMRRHSDLYMCSGCGKKYELAQLADLVGATTST